MVDSRDPAPVARGEVPAARTLSIVVPCYHEEEVFEQLRDELTRLADEATRRFDLDVELVLVDDGSGDGTWPAIRAFAEADRRVRGVSLARNFGHQLALTCGYDLASGDAVVCMDADLQDPPEAVLEMVAAWRDGADIVIAVRRTRAGETHFKLWTASLFYRLIEWVSSVRIPRQAGDFRLMSRRALDALNSMREQHRFIRGMVGWVGFETRTITYDRRKRAAGTTKYPLRKMLHLAIDATVSFSIAPLRLTFLAAAIMSLVILGYLGWVVCQWLFFNGTFVPGWTSLLLSIMGFGALNLVCVGILGEYVGRIYEESKRRPLYLVRTQTVPDPPVQRQESPE